jgi:hypothetical protein
VIIRHMILAVTCLCGLAAHADSSIPDTESKKIMQSLINSYQNSKTFRELVRRNPGSGPDSEKQHEMILGAGMDKPLPKLSYDLTQKTFAFGTHKLQFTDLANGVALVDGREYKWDDKKTYFENYGQIFLLTREKRKAAGVSKIFLAAAQAQDRGFFPETNDVAQEQSLKESSWKDIGFNVGQSMGLAMFVKGATAAVLGEVGLIAVQMQFYSSVVNYAHAYISPSCKSQIENLKGLMNKFSISLSKFQCAGMLSKNDKNNVGFWTPDKKNLPFVADWETSQLYVDPTKETYKFGFSALKSVNTADGETLTSGEQFEEYKKNLEPYRKVLYAMGVSNSCYKCESDFQELVKRRPGPYPMDGAPERPTPPPVVH